MPAHAEADSSTRGPQGAGQPVPATISRITRWLARCLLEIQWGQSMREKGYTLIELLVVVAIIGLVAAIAIPNLINALNRARQKRTMADMRAISEAVEMYHQDLSFFPIHADVHADVLRPDLRIYVKQFNGFDGWNHPFMYTSGGDNYTLVSRGSDGTPDGAWSLGTTFFYECDIVFSGGAFMQWPEGGQR